MAENNDTTKNNVYSDEDSLDINELVSLNEDITNDFIDQLQKKISNETRVKNDGDLFEEPADKNAATFNKDIDDNFIKKYKAKLNKNLNNAQENTNITAEHSKKEEPQKVEMPTLEKESGNETDNKEQAQAPHSKKENTELETKKHTANNQPEEPVDLSLQDRSQIMQPAKDNIEAISEGNITEKPINKETLDYNEKLQYLDNNINYSKYVIYIEPENKDFLDSLTVKERKNLINRIIKEQDSIAITKRKFGKLQTIITHAIVAILTVTIAVPCIYWTINASFEATINNYRTSQVVFGKLYKEHGKLKQTRK